MRGNDQQEVVRAAQMALAPAPSRSEGRMDPVPSQHALELIGQELSARRCARKKPKRRNRDEDGGEQRTHDAHAEAGDRDRPPAQAHGNTGVHRACLLARPPCCLDVHRNQVFSSV